MKILKLTLLLATLSVTFTLSGCISIKRETEPSTTTTTRVSSSTAPSTTVERTTVY